MHFELFEFVDHRGRGVATEWLSQIDSESRGKIAARIKMLEIYGPGLPTTILSDTGHPNIKKLRCRGRKNPRQLLCRGPISMHTEFTLFRGVFEKDDVMPQDALDRAAEMRDEVIGDPKNRRRRYVSS